MYADFRSQAALDARQAELRAIARKYPVSTATGVGAELRRKFLTEVRTLEKWAHRRVYTATWPFFLVVFAVHLIKSNYHLCVNAL